MEVAVYSLCSRAEGVEGLYGCCNDYYEREEDEYVENAEEECHAAVEANVWVCGAQNAAGEYEIDDVDY